MHSLSVAVMAHPRREHLVPELVARLAPAEPAVVWDEKNDPWDTGARAIAAFSPSATHHVIVQDDAIVCDEFVAGVAHVLRSAPAGHPMGLYFGSRVPHSPTYEQMYRRAVAKDRRWIAPTTSPMWGVALVLPTEHIPDLLAFAAKLRLPGYDGRIRLWYRRRKIPCWYPRPSLVEHRTGDDQPSLMRHRKNQRERVAYEFIGEDVSPLSIDWHTPPIR